MLKAFTSFKDRRELNHILECRKEIFRIHKWFGFIKFFLFQLFIRKF